MVHQTLSRTRPTATLHNTHARSLITLERFDQAELALRECVRLEPRRAAAHDSLAQLIWIRTGDIVEATRVLDQVLEKYQLDDALWATKAALLQGAGDARGAYACLAERAAQPQPPPALLIRAGLAALDFEPATALSLAKQAMRAQPNNPTARKLLCAAYLGVGEGDAALAECAILLQATPDDQYLIAMQATALRLMNDPRYEALCDYDKMVLSQVLETPPGWSDLDRLPDRTHFALERPAQSARPSTALPIIAPGHRDHPRSIAERRSGHSSAVSRLRRTDRALSRAHRPRPGSPAAPQSGCLTIQRQLVGASAPRRLSHEPRASARMDIIGLLYSAARQHASGTDGRRHLKLRRAGDDHDASTGCGVVASS